MADRLWVTVKDVLKEVEQDAEGDHRVSVGLWEVYVPVPEALQVSVGVRLEERVLDGLGVPDSDLLPVPVCEWLEVGADEVSDELGEREAVGREGVWLVNDPLIEDVGGDRVAERVAEPVREMDENDADMEWDPPLGVNVWVGNGVGVSVGDGWVSVVQDGVRDGVGVGDLDMLRMGEAVGVPDSECDLGDGEGDVVAERVPDTECVFVSRFVAL